MSMRARAMYNCEVAVAAALVNHQFAAMRFVIARFRLIDAVANNEPINAADQRPGGAYRERSIEMAHPVTPRFTALFSRRTSP